jgi:hypothetical protein
MFHGESLSKLITWFFVVTTLILSVLLYKEQDRKETLFILMQDAHNADNYNQALYLSTLKSLECIMDSASEEDLAILNQIVEIHALNAEDKLTESHIPQRVKNSFKDALELVPVECKSET